MKIRPAPEVLADEDILEMVNAGLVPMTMADDYVAEFWRQIFPGMVLNTGAAVRTDGQTAMMVRKNSPKLMAELNAFIAHYPEGSMQRNVLLQKYLKSVKYAKPATSKEDLSRFNQTVDYLRKYSDQYKLDYLLMAAQGYQESGLDPGKKSPVGAIGVMQVMPKTGARAEGRRHHTARCQRPRGCEIHALHDRSLLRRRTDGSTQQGPVHLRFLQRRARPHPAASRDAPPNAGFDPNKWFNNVEIVAAEKHRPGDRAVRLEHLQVLPRLQNAQSSSKSSVPKRRLPE